MHRTFQYRYSLGCCKGWQAIYRRFFLPAFRYHSLVESNKLITFREWGGCSNRVEEKKLSSWRDLTSFWRQGRFQLKLGNSYHPFPGSRTEFVLLKKILKTGWHKENRTVGWSRKAILLVTDKFNPVGHRGCRWLTPPITRSIRLPRQGLLSCSLNVKRAHTELERLPRDHNPLICE